MTAQFERESSVNEVGVVTDQLLFLQFGEKAYDGHGMYTVEEDTPKFRLGKLLESPASVEARKMLLENVQEFDRRLSLIPKDAPNFDQEMRRVIKQIAIDSANNNLEGKPLQDKLDFIKNLDKIDGMLFLHLDETARATVSFSEAIKDNLVSKKRGQLFTPHQLELMEFVALTHDLPKLLGEMNAQIDSDHEVIYRNIMLKHLEGRSFIPKSGIPLKFDKSGVDFCTKLSGFHEDIWREEYFSKQVASLKKDKIIDPGKIENQDIAVERARMIFHFIDIFGDAVGFQDGKLTIVNKEAFEARFIDLFRRHIKMPIKIVGGEKKEDWTRAKVTRPGWGLHGVAGLTWTFAELAAGWGIALDPKLLGEVQLGIAEVIQDAIVAAEEVIKKFENDADGSKKTLKVPEVPTKYTLVVPENAQQKDIDSAVQSLNEALSKLYDARDKLIKEIGPLDPLTVARNR